MANIVKLRMAGFKSFMEAAEFGIDTGLTGVVGPNGCGKSNVVEAFRWAMGETSAKQLRGGGMDDVIFAGAAGRPSRNHAEVSISMSDPDGEFPMPWVGQTEIEISRKIERGGGSTSQEQFQRHVWRHRTCSARCARRARRARRV